MQPLEELKTFLKRLTSESIFPALKKNAEESSAPVVEKLDEVVMVNEEVKDAVLVMRDDVANAQKEASDSIVQAIHEEKDVSIPIGEKIDVLREALVTAIGEITILNGKDGLNGRKTMVSSESEPAGAQEGDLWYQP